MKRLIIILVMIQALASSGAEFIVILGDKVGTNYLSPVTNVFNLTIMQPYWLVSTNWSDSGASRTLMWPDSANTTTYYETGTVTSNLIAQIQYGDSIQFVTLESRHVTTFSRSYIKKEVKEYR
jgi:hypothetical protein